MYATGTTSKKPVWNFHPEIPLTYNPLCQWPLDLGKMVLWYVKIWLNISEITIYVGLGIIAWMYLQPPMAIVETLGIDWIAQCYIRNFCLMLLVAGSLHLYFYTFNAQGHSLKFDARGLERNNKRFTFNNQVWDNMFWTLASGVTFWTAYESVILWNFANGTVSTITWSDSPIWFILLFLFIPAFSAIHFYAVHRLLHWPPLYKVAHALHHRNVSTGPWSGLSMHPLEHFIYLTSPFIHLVVPSHPIHVFFHFYFLTLAAATSHTGYYGIFVAGKCRFRFGVFYHQLHHRFFECNYGNAEFPVDVFAGSFHDGTSQHDEKIRERRARKFGRT